MKYVTVTMPAILTMGFSLGILGLTGAWTHTKDPCAIMVSLLWNLLLSQGNPLALSKNWSQVVQMTSVRVLYY